MVYSPSPLPSSLSSPPPPPNNSSSNSSNVKVVVRLRPMNATEEAKGTLPVVKASSADNTIMTVRGSGMAQQRSNFTFDTVFSSYASQEEVFDLTLRPVIRDVLQGYESTVFAYGQTGTGKTHTMEGNLKKPELYGIIPRSARYIFNGLQKKEYISHSVLVSYLEIYNEELCDLLSTSSSSVSNSSSSGNDTNFIGIQENNNYNNIMNNSNSNSNYNMSNNNNNNHQEKQQKLEIMESRDGVFCRGLTEREVYSAADVLAVMKTAQKHRKVSETAMNMKSSRSHCVFTIQISAQKKLRDGRVLETRGKLHLVDLAGSECAKTSSVVGTTASFATGGGTGGVHASSAAVTAASPLDSSGKKRRKESTNHGMISRERGRERSNINRSLLTLGRVILMLNKQSSSRKPANIRIPYRDSKLTRILQNSLGGKCKTLIIATLSPSEEAIDETMSTLNYAQSASGIVNKPIAVSFLKNPDSRPSTPLRGAEETKGVEHWYQMEIRMAYLESQLEEAQAALARHYEEQSSIVDRAERAEAELCITKRKLESSEKNYRKSITILREAKQIIVAQQHEIKGAKIEQKRQEKQMMNNVLHGVTDLVNDQVNLMSAKHEDQLSQVQEKNNIIGSLTDEVRSSAINIIKDVDAKNTYLRRRSQAIRRNDELMITSSKRTNNALSDLDKLWNRQKQFVDKFVMKTSEKAAMLAEHEVAAATACSKLEEDSADVGSFIATQVRDSVHSGSSTLWDLASLQTKYARVSALASTSNHLKEMKKLQSDIVSNYTSTADDIFRSVEKGKENIGNIMHEQCDIIDELRCDVETKCGDFENDASVRMHPAIDARNNRVIDSSDDFNQIAKLSFSSTMSFTSTLKKDTDRFGKGTVNEWVQAPPVKDKRIIEYSKTLSSTPSDEVLLKDFEHSVNAQKLRL